MKLSRFGIFTFGSVSAFIVSLASISLFSARLAIAASSSGLPRCGVSANDTPAVVASSNEETKRMRLGVMLDLAVACDAPACDRVAMLIWKTQYRWRLCQLAANGNEFGAGRLHVTRFVPCPAL